jgi:NAD(P)-dependent dehydrogenase (short-subunit alcohol dehydrogenase family)
MKPLTGKVCVVTGAGSGIGRGLALELATRGGRLAISDINAETLAATETAVRARGAEVESYVLDVACREAVFANADAVREHFGTVNLVINNAGVAVSKDVVDMPIEDIEWLMGINFWGVIYGSKAFLPHLIASGDGYLVNISSLFGLLAVPGQSAYNSAKFAVRGFTEALRQELLIAGHPVGVTCVHPGGIKTAIARNSGAVAGLDAGELARFFDEHLARTSPESAARAILRAMRRGRARALVGVDAKLLDGLVRLTGSGYQRFIVRRAGALTP